MTPDSLKDFLIACVGASASFIGLLFVALYVVLTRNDGNNELEFNDRRLAETSFTALADIFFVCIAGLLSISNIGIVSFIASLFGLLNVWRLYRRLGESNDRAKRSDMRKNLVWLVGTMFIYTIQIIYALLIMMHPSEISNYNAMMGILLGLFGVALARTWALTGIRAK